MSGSSTCIVVFAKAPVAGQVKTRLIPALGAQSAADLHCALLHHTLTTVRSTSHDVELWCAPNSAHAFFWHLRAELQIVLRDQAGVDLGARMAVTFADALVRFKHVLLIGSDCPGMSKADIDAAFETLKRNDAVLGPATDGGYWLMGLSRFDRSLFEGLAWGGNTVLHDTLIRLRRLGWRYQLLAEHNDIDRVEDLDLLPAALRVWR